MIMMSRNSSGESFPFAIFVIVSPSDVLLSFTKEDLYSAVVESNKVIGDGGGGKEYELEEIGFVVVVVGVSVVSVGNKTGQEDVRVTNGEVQFFESMPTHLPVDEHHTQGSTSGIDDGSAVKQSCL